MYQLREFILDPQSILIFLISFVTTLPSVAASSFSSLIVQGFGFTALQTTVISSIPASLIQIMSLSGLGYLASRKSGLRLYLAVLSSLPPLVGAALLHSLPTSNTGGRLAGYYLTFTHSAAYIFALSLLASNFGGATKKLLASASVFVAYSAGLIAGPQFFLSIQSPNYTQGFSMMMATYALIVPLLLILRLYYVWENKRRDRLVAEENASGKVVQVQESGEFTDATDREQWRTFRYAM